MRIIDTHTHLYLDDFKADIKEVLRRGLEAGVSLYYLPNIDSQSIPAMLELEEHSGRSCRAMMGLHPCSVKEDFRHQLTLMEDWLARRSFAAIGETGLDFHWDLSYKEFQMESLRIQLSWARSLDIPVVLHTRKSMDDCLRLVTEMQDGRLKGIFHCFGGTLEQAFAIRDLGFFMGIGGVVTYKNGGLGPVIKEMGLDHFVLETDAPYLAPVPYRGKRNEPAFLREIIQTMATIAELGVEEVAAATTRNAELVFGSALTDEYP